MCVAFLLFALCTTSISATVSQAAYGVDWKTTTHNGGTGPYKIWVRVASGDGKYSNEKLLGYLYRVSSISTGFAFTDGETFALQGHREHIGNPVEKISGTYFLSN